MTLSALSGSAVGGLVLGLAFVFGMVFPLFVMALLWDRFGLGERRLLQAKPVTLHLPRGREIHTNTVNVIVAIAFAVMGAFILYLADTGSMTTGPGFQVAIGEWLATVFAQVEVWTAGVPEPLLGAALLAIAGVFVWATLRPRHRPQAPADAAGADLPDAPCHHCEPADPAAPATVPATTSSDTEGTRS
jgi:hypothetical protein